MHQQLLASMCADFAQRQRPLQKPPQPLKATRKIKATPHARSCAATNPAHNCASGLGYSAAFFVAIAGSRPQKLKCV